MLIGAFLLGALLSLAVCALLWGTGRRPYLRVDVERHETREVVHVLPPVQPTQTQAVHHLVHTTEPAPGHHAPTALRPARRRALVPVPPVPTMPPTRLTAHRRDHR